ncbi:Uncharacterized protein TCM_029431 [Theobroma cacao]|uniref:Uncharacterized protein n=1 Tax=Theobroma cacao TaxID=3641 RepID=A0A061GCN8_THECC|nr:Uncharacterized protein TCM_029431 [Theobroma cacao]
MMKKVGYKQNWGAVAPAPLICPRRSSTCPRLETIHEEGCEYHAVFSNKVFLVLPVVLSTVFYFFLYKEATLCA